MGVAPAESVWMDLEDDEGLFDAAEGRVKPSTLRGNPRVLTVGVTTPGGTGLHRPQGSPEGLPLTSPDVLRNGTCAE